MFSNIIYTQGTAEVSLAAGDYIAVATKDAATAELVVGYPNQPESRILAGTVSNGVRRFGPVSEAATVVISAGAADVLYSVGTDVRVLETQYSGIQIAPTELNATGTLTAAAIVDGIVTSTTAAGVTATLDTGAIMDAAVQMSVDDSFDWSVINTGPNAFTVTAAASGHTVVGAGAVATGTSGLFRTRKTAADTFVTYRIG